MSSDSKFNILWNIIIVASSAFLAVYVPLNLYYNFSSENTFTYLSIIVTFIFLADIVVNLLRQRRGESEIVFDKFSNLNFYLKYWLLIDVISAIPFDLFLPLSSLQLLRLIKLIKVAFIMSSWRQNVVRYNNLLKFLFFSFWILLGAHWISCGWIFLNVKIYEDNLTNYISSLYWTITTLSTVGYGDIVPQNNLQKIYTIFVMIMGVAVYGYVIGNIAGILSKRDPSKTNYLSNIEKLNALIHFRNIPLKLQSKLRDYYKYMWKQKLDYNESTFLNGLPIGLRIEVSLYLKKESVERIQLFNKASDEFITEIAHHLKPIVYTPGDFVFKIGDKGEEMFFVVNGNLVVKNAENKILAAFNEGDFFGEIALLNDSPRNANVIAVTYCDLYSLSKQSFDYVIAKYPDIARSIEKTISQRL